MELKDKIITLFESDDETNWELAIITARRLNLTNYEINSIVWREILHKNNKGIFSNTKLYEKTFKNRKYIILDIGSEVFKQPLKRRGKVSKQSLFRIQLEFFKVMNKIIELVLNK